MYHASRRGESEEGEYRKKHRFVIEEEKNRVLSRPEFNKPLSTKRHPKLSTKGEGVQIPTANFTAIKLSQK